MAAQMELAKSGIYTIREIWVDFLVKEARKDYRKNDVHVDKEAKHGREPERA
jgi:hypothetical protein